MYQILEVAWSDKNQSELTCCGFKTDSNCGKKLWARKCLKKTCSAIQFYQPVLNGSCCYKQ